MGVSVGELDRRQVEKLRVELAETLAAQFAYPPFFDFAGGKSAARPTDRAKRQEIGEFLRSVNFTALERAAVRSPDVRRFLERLLLRYIEVNPALNRPQFSRCLPQLRARVPRLAADLQRGLGESLAGQAPAFGAPRPPESWREHARRGPHLREEDLEHNTGVLQAVLARARVAADAPLASFASDFADTTRDAPAPIPTRGAGLAPAGARDARHPAELPAYRAPASGPPREVSPDLYQMYGDYLSDMQAEPPTTPTPAPPARVQALPGGPPTGSGAAPAADQRSDTLIFSQLRYQLEAYVRRAARSYGLPNKEGDPARIIDALRDSRMVDGADLRIVEGILALTDRVTAQGGASIEDYRQAFMLYLLYHRSHLGS